MIGHADDCPCWRCVQEGPDDERAELHADDQAAERADRALAYADGRLSNYPEGWGDAPW